MPAFEKLKSDLCSAPALAGPDYSKPFHLYVSEKQGFANAMLTQQQGPGKQPIAYFSTTLDNVEQGMPSCYRGLAAAAAFAYQKGSAITMGHPTISYTTHALHTLLTSPAFVITHACKTGYDLILSAPELTIQRCQTVNPADRMVTPLESEPHDCGIVSNKYLKALQDLENQPFPQSSLTLFVDGLFFRGTDGNLAGYAPWLQIQIFLHSVLFKPCLSVNAPLPSWQSLRL